MWCFDFFLSHKKFNVSVRTLSSASTPHPFFPPKNTSSTFLFSQSYLPFTSLADTGKKSTIWLRTTCSARSRSTSAPRCCTPTMGWSSAPQNALSRHSARSHGCVLVKEAWIRKERERKRGRAVVGRQEEALMSRIDVHECEIGVGFGFKS